MLSGRCTSLLVLLTICYGVAFTAAHLFVPCRLLSSFAATLNLAHWKINQRVEASASTVYAASVRTASAESVNMEEDKAIAVRFKGALDAQGFPASSTWNAAPALRFNTDWQGKNSDPQRETEVRLLWTPGTLYLWFRARYRVITVFPDATPDGRRDQLWDRDVAEVFLQPDSSDPLRYKEFEVSPNGLWIDLDISHGEKQDLQSGLRRRVLIDEKNRTWTAELAIPMESLTPQFDPGATWRVNFYRVEGATEPRFYSAWRPTRTPEPDFHVPEAFGKLIFAEVASKQSLK